jgi:CDP-glycerol glycerophosphotransferase
VAAAGPDDVEECVRSVLRAGHRPVEVLVCGGPPARRPRQVRRLPAELALDEVVAAARGDYVAFALADDILVSGGLPRLVAALEGSGSDLVTALPDACERRGTTLEADPEVLADLGAAGKLFRLVWWRAAGLALGSWESAPVAVTEAMSAAVIDVVPVRVYERRVRDATLSLDRQRRFRADLAAERFRALRTVGRLLARRDPVLYAGWLVRTFRDLLPGWYADAVGGGERYFTELQPLVAALLADLDPESAALVPVEGRLGAWVAAHGTLDDLASLLDHLALNPHGLPVHGDVADLPLGLSADPTCHWRRIEPVDRRRRLRLGHLVREGAGGRIEGSCFTEYVEPSPLPAVGLHDVAAEVSRRHDDATNLWARRAWEDRGDAGFVARWEEMPALGGSPVEVAVTWDGQTDTAIVEEAPEGRGAESGLQLARAELRDDRLTLHCTGRQSPRRARITGPHGTTAWGTVGAGSDGVVLDVRLVSRQLGADALLPAGRYRLEVVSDDMSWVPVRASWSDEAVELVAEQVGVRLSVADGVLKVVVAPPLGKDARSAFRQQRWRTHVYAAVPRATSHRTVLLETFRGRSVGDNPGAIATELLSRDLDLDLVWVVDDPSVCVPHGTRPVFRRTEEWHELLARARFYVSNAAAPVFFDKRPGQVHLQTWHGTPLKRIGEDRGPGDLATWRHRRVVSRQAAGWDAMVSPSPYCSEIFKRAFGFTGLMLEVGHPRNDVLLSARAPQVRARARERLGLGEDDRAVLYAPTWREYAGRRDAKPLFLDAETVTRELSDTVVLVRGHYNASKQADVFDAHPRIVDVTRYPDIADLYLASDVLVTDYSSVMFDFVVTDKPMVLLTPDLAQYRDVERGFYFDIESWAPGPMVTTTKDVVRLVADTTVVRATYSESRRAFRERFCPHDDGGASARVVDAWLASWP